MPKHAPPSDDRIAAVAEQRAAGASWDAAAAATGWPKNTIRQWPRMYPYRWRAAYLAAEHQLYAEAAAESVLTLRNQLRSADEKAVRDAADKLLKHQASRRPRATRGRPKRPPAPPRAVRLAEYVSELTDDQLDALITELAPPADGNGLTPGGPLET